MRSAVFIFFLLFAFPFVAESANQETSISCHSRTISEGTIFTFTIERSFQPALTFILCQKKETNQSYLQISSELKRDSANKIVTLTDNEFMELMKFYENALTYNAKDSEFGLDGSTWCLETKRGLNYSKACFYTPSYNANDRGLSGLHQLGVELWRVGNLDAHAGKLY